LEAEAKMNKTVCNTRRIRVDIFLASAMIDFMPRPSLPLRLSFPEQTQVATWGSTHGPQWVVLKGGGVMRGRKESNPSVGSHATGLALEKGALRHFTGFDEA